MLGLQLGLGVRSPWHVGLEADVGAAAGSRRGAWWVGFEPLLLLLHSHLQHVDLPWEQVEGGRYRQLARDRQNEIVPVFCNCGHTEKIKIQPALPLFNRLFQREFDVTDLTDGVDETLPQLPGFCTRHLWWGNRGREGR